MQQINKVTRKIAWSTLVQYGGRIVQIGLAMLTVKLLANFFSKAQLGDYDMLKEYALFFFTVANFGIFANVVRQMADRPTDSKVFTNALIVRLITAVVVFAIALIGAPFFFEDQILISAVMIFIGSLLFDYITQICDAMLQANYLMGRATFALVLGRIVNFGVLTWMMLAEVPCFLQKLGGAQCGGLFDFQFNQASDSALQTIFYAPLIGSLVTMIVTIFFVRQKMKLVWKYDHQYCLKLFISGFPYGMTNILNNLYFRFLPMFLAAKFLEDGEFSTFQKPYTIAFVLSMFSTFLMFSVMPTFKKNLQQGRWKEAKMLFGKVKKFLLVISLLLVVVMPWFGPLLITILTNKTLINPELWFVFPMFLLLAAISYFYDLILVTLYSMNREWWLLRREFIALAGASLVFVLAFLMPNFQAQVVVVILGAIVGELLMVMMGLKEIKREFVELSK